MLLCHPAFPDGIYRSKKKKNTKSHINVWRKASFSWQSNLFCCLSIVAANSSLHSTCCSCDLWCLSKLTLQEKSDDHVAELACIVTCGWRQIRLTKPGKEKYLFEFRSLTKISLGSLWCHKFWFSQSLIAPIDNQHYWDQVTVEGSSSYLFFPLLWSSAAVRLLVVLLLLCKEFTKRCLHFPLNIILLRGIWGTADGRTTATSWLF